MPRERTGSIIKIKGKIYARMQYIGSNGKRRELRRLAENRTHARELIKQLSRELDDYGDRTLDGGRMRFSDLADYYAKHYLVPPVYAGDRKVAGLRSLLSLEGQMRTLRETFGKRGLRSITYGDIRSFRSLRLSTPTQSGKTRSLASVHRELSLMRRMLNVAVREGWLLKNPMRDGEPLISLANEHKRQRVLSREEEERLLIACEHPRRKHLRVFLICALDSGCRKGELLKLKWGDVDFERQTLNIRAANTKTLQYREVAISARMSKELERLYEQSPKDQDALVFGQSDVKRAFTSARKEAGLIDVRLHDLRHSFASRLAQGHLPIAEIARTLGHATLEMSYRYINADDTTINRARNIIDGFHAANDATETDDAAALIN